MFKLIPNEILLDIAEFAPVNRYRGINPMGLSDEELIQRIKLYNKDFDVKKWKEDLEKKRELRENGTYQNYDNYRDIYQTYVHKPDEDGEILNIPDTLEEYLSKLASYYQNKYRPYFELLTGNWSIQLDYKYGDDNLFIMTDSSDELYDMI